MKTTCWSFKPSLRMGKKGDLSDFDCGMVVGARRAGRSISKTAVSGQLCGRKCLVDVRGQRRMRGLVRDDRKATVTHITTRYNQAMQNTISKCTICRTLKQMGYSSRRPHRGPLLSAKNRKRRRQFSQARQNWTIEDWINVAWSDESRSLLQYDRVRI